jgi:hypothetical protein
MVVQACGLAMSYCILSCVNARQRGAVWTGVLAAGSVAAQLLAGYGGRPTPFQVVFSCFAVILGGAAGMVSSRAEAVGHLKKTRSVHRQRGLPHPPGRGALAQPEDRHAYGSLPEIHA